MGGVNPSSEKLHIFALKCKKQITVEPNKMYITSARLHCFYEIIDTLDCSPAMSVCDIAHLMLGMIIFCGSVNCAFGTFFVPILYIKRYS